MTAPPDVDTTRVLGNWCRHVPDAGAAPDPFHRGIDSDGRWQTTAVCGGFYLADEPDTAWSEWYRFLAAAGLAPAANLPRYLLRYQLDLRLADLRSADALHRVGLQPPDPDDDWRPFQAIGAALYATGHAGLITTSAARPKAHVVCLFRGPRMLTPDDVTFQPPAEHHATAPRIPRGLRT